MQSTNEAQLQSIEQSQVRAETLLDLVEKRVRQVEAAVSSPGDSSPTIAKIAGALAKAQGEFLPVRKSQINKYRGNKYADLSDVLDAARPALAKHGLALVQRATTTTAADLYRGSVKVSSLLLHESGEWISDSCELPVLPMPRGKNTEFVAEDDVVTAQAFGSAITYARRYSAATLLGLAAESESESAAVEGERAGEAALAKARATATQQKTKPARTPSPTEVTFGPRKGADASKLSSAELEESLDVGRAQVAKAKGDEPWVPKVKAALVMLQNEKAKRFSQLAAPEVASQAGV